MYQVLYSVSSLPELNNSPLHVTGSKNHKVGGGLTILFCVSAYRPDSAILTLMTAGSNPAESELFSSSARRQTNAALAVRLTGSRVAGLEVSMMNVRFLTEIRPDSLAGNGRVYVSASSIVWLLILISFSLQERAPHADRRLSGSPPYATCPVLTQFPGVCSAFYPAKPHPRAVKADKL